MAQRDPNLSNWAVWATRLALWSLRLALFSLAVAAIGLTLARYDLIAKLAGFSALLGGGLISALALILALQALSLVAKAAILRGGVASPGLQFPSPT